MKNNTNSRKKPISKAKLQLRNFLICFLTLILSIGFSLWFLLCCRVKFVTVKNASIVPEPTILDAADIKAGCHLYAVNEAKIERKILAESPYIKSVTLVRKLPTTLQISIEEYNLAYYIEYGEHYYLVTNEFLVIEETTPEDADYKGAVPLTIPSLKDPKATKENPNPPKILRPMQTLTFAEKENKAWALSLLSAIEQTNFADDIVLIDLSDPMNLQLCVSGKYTVLLGNEKDFQKKLTRVENAIQYLSENMYGLIGIIHAEKDAPITFSFTGTIPET